ncbi:MAG: phosphomethylpyrimidine synthase ThiC [Methanomicrobia archaeon]|nr:phosphomethylpyrimidine synthase ThiC [Methanomicrobia archaeon]HDM22999.1 phosphomethylpyrimidine synthase ThiC [Methanomicrobia archaeon]
MDIEEIAKKEEIEEERLKRYIKEGKIVILKNINHDIEPVAVGKGVRVKVNANIGTSRSFIDLETEKEKARVAEKYGADTIMDLSTGGDLDKIRREIMKTVSIPIGTVPIYQAAEEQLKRKRAIVEMTEDDIFNAIEKHLKDGVDFITVHVGVTRETIKKLRERLCSVVSRGGSFLAAWMIHNEEENPLYRNFDYLLEMAKNFDAVLSLGDGLRPGCIKDATDFSQLSELYTLGKLVRRSREYGVQSMVEGPGHIPLDQIEANVLLEKKICDEAPFYVLGPIVTDVSLGYDHITGAIGGAMAALYGADFLCYVTPSEHLALPTVEDVKLGVIASRIAAHSVNLLRKKRSFEKDMSVARGRKLLNWKTQITHSIDPEFASSVRKERSGDMETCSMCGDLCAIKILREALK